MVLIPQKNTAIIGNYNVFNRTTEFVESLINLFLYKKQFRSMILDRSIS
jgi:hypothetical protein